MMEPCSDYQWAVWRDGNPFAHEDLAVKRAIVAKLADRYDATFVPLREPVAAAARERGAAVVAGDGVHPSAFGRQLLARLWLEAYDRTP
jgi:acyl-CoA thioesterase-1